MAQVFGEETLYGVNDIPERMAKLQREGSTLLPIPLREEAMKQLRAERTERQRVANERSDMSLWDSIVGKMGTFQFAGAVLAPCQPGENKAGNVGIGTAVAVLGGIVAIDYAIGSDDVTSGKRTMFRLHVPAAAIIAFLEVTGESDIPRPSSVLIASS